MSFYSYFVQIRIQKVPGGGLGVSKELITLVSDSATPWTVCPDSSAHGILQARILEWVTIPFSRGSSQPRARTQVSHSAGRSFTIQAIGEALGMALRQVSATPQNGLGLRRLDLTTSSSGV